MSANVQRTGMLVAACALLAACSLLSRRGPEPRRDSIRVPHGQHTRGEVECLACHEEIYDAQTLGASYRPPEAKCFECHAEQQSRRQCSYCHENPRFAAPYPRRPPHLRMSHAQHIERVQEHCNRCHVNLPEPGVALPLTPAMSRCLSCHNHRADFDRGRCDLCHVDLARFPLRPLSVFSHRGNWLRTHRLAARTAGDRCALCHDQSFCSDCHASTVALPIEVRLPDRVDRDFIHGNDFVSRHPIEARAGRLLCARCHGQSFCEDCHRLQNVAPAGAEPRSPHPAGWVALAGPSLHGPAARRDIALCASCHDQGAASNCVICHRVGGVGGDPHPPGWTARHPQQDIEADPMCRICHM